MRAYQRCEMKEQKKIYIKKYIKNERKQQQRFAIKIKQFLDLYIGDRNNEWMKEREGARLTDWQAERQSERETKLIKTKGGKNKQERHQ